MSLSRDDVANIAHLARLTLSEAELPAYVGSLSKILDLVAQLGAADVANVTPMAHPLADQVQRLRTDEVVAMQATTRDQYQCNAPHVEAGLYLVPKVIE